ncbi:MAG: hypothetical protein ABIR50_00090 [Ginsengibacter sp.]
MPLHDQPTRSFYIKSLAYFADILQVDVSDNAINIPDHLGFGFIRVFFLEEGIILRYFNFKLKHDIEYNLTEFDQNRDGYNFFFLLNKNFFFSEKSEIGGTFLFCNEYERKLKIRRGDYIYAINLMWIPLGWKLITLGLTLP